MERFLLVPVGIALIVSCGDDSGEGGAGGAAAGSIQVQVSGEDIATEGLEFPEGEVVIADGWEIRFDHVFVTIGRVWVSDNPDRAPSDPSQTGETVAEAVGPWAVDLAMDGALPGAGGEGTAVPLVVIENQNKKGGSAFAADQRYAFSYSTVAATAGATPVNFADDAAAVAEYAALEAEGCAMAYIGTATFVGTQCDTSDPAYDFTAIPASVPFRLCFATPTEYVNCQNQDNQGDPFPDEEFQRGIALASNGTAIAQLTFHLEHAFYSDVEHEPVLFFDQLAAALVGQPAGTELELSMLAGVDPTAFQDGAGDALPWRTCDGTRLPAGAQRGFETGTIPVGPAVDPTMGLRDYVDYVRYVQSSLGHLNGGEGLCYIDRKYPSPR
jgi:hypothetical protein